jgi:hypothetical protein
MIGSLVALGLAEEFRAEGGAETLQRRNPNEGHAGNLEESRSWGP